MRDPTISHHTEWLCSTPRHHQLARSAANNYYRPTLNLRSVVELIRSLSPLGASENSDSQDKGKKRAREESSEDNGGGKRLRTASGSFRSMDNEKVDDPYPASAARAMVYPSRGHFIRSAPSLREQSVTAFEHVMEVNYLADVQGDATNFLTDFNNSDEWREEEEWFRDQITSICEGLEEPCTVDLGIVNVVRDGDGLGFHSDRLVAISDVAARIHMQVDQENHGMAHCGPWLALIPSYNPEDLSWEDLDFVSSNAEDLLVAAHTLSCRAKARIDLQLKIVLLPIASSNSSRNEFPFRLQFHFTVSFVTPEIFESPQSMLKRTMSGLEDAQRRILHFLQPSDPPPSFKGAIDIPFFFSILGPAPTLKSKLAENQMQPVGMLPTLLPFQRRSVAWLLDREGMIVSKEGKIIPKENPTNFTFWKAIQLSNEVTWYYHCLSGTLSPTPPDAGEPALGAILAEEPGLGKTIETIAMIMLNPAPPERNPSVKRWDPEAKVDVKAIKSTLIVTPATLASQWVDELKKHAPSLKVLVYDGWSTVKVPINESQVEEARAKALQAKKKAKRRTARAGSKAKAVANIEKYGRAKEEEEDYEMALVDEELGEEKPMDWCAYAHTFDVVITTYNVLQQDLNVARAPPRRPRRDGVVYSNVERPRSPLIMVEWNRVVMDEVQMVGGGKTEDMVSLIPRLSSFAVSGTPARADIRDLSHVLKFLRVDIGPARFWQRLFKPAFARQFADLFQYYSIRTMKSAVSHELTIPQQTRFLVPIEMGRVERHVYDQTFEGVLNELGLDARGVAASEGWEVDGNVLRAAVRRLRGICTHPQVGQLQKPNDKLYRPGTLKTMEDVLQMMKDQNWRNLIEDWRTKIHTLLKIAQLQQLDTKSRNRFLTMLETLNTAEEEVKKMVQEIQDALAEEHAKGEILKREAAEKKEMVAQAQSNRDTRDTQTKDKDKGKRRERSVSPGGLEDDDDEEDADIPKTPAGEEHRIKMRALRQRLREGKLVHHKVKFLQGDVYHNLGQTFSSKEDGAYDAAEKLRKELLKVTEDEAKRGMAQLQLDVTKSGVAKKDLVLPVPFLEQGGIRSAESIETLHEIIEDVLNEQAELLWEWRSMIYSLLTKSLSAPDEDVDGQEYQRTLDNQGEAETYLQAYAALLADRREALVNERTLLAAHDVKEKKLRTTRAALKAIAADDQLEFPADVDIQPQHEVLHQTLSNRRKELLLELNGRAVKSILVELQTAFSKLRDKENDPEKVLLQNSIADLRRLINSQQSNLENLDADLALFRKAFNQRVLYFRQLQEISDSVADFEYEGSREEVLEEAETEKKELGVKINTARARQRYLDHLVKTQSGGDADEDDRLCILCRCEFDRGFITMCAHIFCEGCMKAWLQRKDGKTCPVCRVQIDPENLQRFKLDGDKPGEPQTRVVNGELIPTSRRKIEYNVIDRNIFDKIQQMESLGDFGAKIQGLVRHLLYLQQEDPGAKSIVFSAWADSLHIVERALSDNNILSLRIDRGVRGEGPAKKFATNPDISVLLLHGERENAGLNVTCASRVFLLESVVHHGFEIQAIARIDRMGQTRPTEVYCYYAEDTVERNILDLAARQGLSLYTKQNAVGMLNVNSLSEGDKQSEATAKKSAKVQKGDFISKIDDMLAVLFPHMYEDVEYLLPVEDVVMGDVTNTYHDHDGSMRVSGVEDAGGKRTRSGRQVNAVAGPSRVRN